MQGKCRVHTQCIRNKKEVRVTLLNARSLKTINSKINKQNLAKVQDGDIIAIPEITEYLAVKS